MKNFKKGFTLVEMLIVVVIIGILSAALLPRLQGAQSSARDAARRSDLNQLGSAILSYYNNRGEYPWSWEDGKCIPASNISADLMSVVELSSLPTDPNKNNQIKFESEEWWLFSWCDTIWSWQYGYLVATKNTIDKWWYILIARSETEWGSNFLSTIQASWDLMNFRWCTSFAQIGESKCAGEPDGWSTSPKDNWLCCYKDKWQLRYVYVF